MQLQNVNPVILIVLVAIIVILFSYINFKKWLTRKQVYVAVFAVILFISFISLKTAVHYNFLKFQSDFPWSSAILAAVIFFTIISPVVLLIYESLRGLSRKNVPIKDTPVSVPIFEEQIDTLPDKRSFGILNEEIYETTAPEIELDKPFEKITEISPMEQVLSNIESGTIKENDTAENSDSGIPEQVKENDKILEEEKIPEQIIPAENALPVPAATANSDDKSAHKVQHKKTGSRSTVKKPAIKKTSVKTPKSRGTTVKKNKK